ncbi:MAG TPA: AraC family transcriptional regulator [Armatimonadota bacterium]|jgi:AraC-like DNA-binding protein
MNLQLPLTVFDGHKALHCPPGWTWHSLENHWTGLHLWLVVQGHGHMCIEGTDYPAHAGCCFVLRMHEVNFGSQDDRDPLVVHAVNFAFLDASAAPLAVSLEDLPYCRTVPNAALLSQLIDLAIDARGHGDAAQAAHWVQSALLLVAHADQHPVAPDTDATRARIQQLCRTIIEEPGAPYTIAAFAQGLCWSPDHFIRVFRQHIGMTPGAFIIHARLEEAKKLLRFANYEIKHIAGLLGYTTPFFFSRQFTQHVGISPSTYREQLRRGSESLHD